ncbi:MAG: thrombospondin type 3 repeat-containing protein, partial [Thermoplasmata archaeon]|nr:thrombospondin type 3 repeat-containing protein [Thermoplasmata archaeon]
MNFTLNASVSDAPSTSWFGLAIKVYFQPYLTNPFVADADNDNLSDRVELEYGTDPLCNDTDHDGIADFNETGRFVDEVSDSHTDWNNSSVHSPGIYFNDLNKTVGTGLQASATAEFNFTVSVSGLDLGVELPKPVMVTATLQSELSSGYFTVTSYYGAVYDENNNTIASESNNNWNDNYAMVTLWFDFSHTEAKRYYVSIIWNYTMNVHKP